MNSINLLSCTLLFILVLGCTPFSTESTSAVSVENVSSSSLDESSASSDNSSMNYSSSITEETKVSSSGQPSSDETGCETDEPCIENSFATCLDGLDNDNDGTVDCADDDCRVFEFCSESTRKYCTDGIDNDNDGTADCYDAECKIFEECQENSLTTCTDGIDNDDDGGLDCDDIDCWIVPGTKCGEYTKSMCNDGIDNDKDGRMDCDDGDCMRYEDICPYQDPSDGYGGGEGGGNGSGGGGSLTLGSVYYPGTTEYSSFQLGGFIETLIDNQSTFGLDVDAASYTLARSVLNSNQLPDSAQVRTEEFINYFTYNYPEPENSVFHISADIAASPFRDTLQVLRVGMRAYTPEIRRQPWNLTFLIDISGSMNGRLDLVKESLSILIDNMKEGDYLSITTYAGSVQTILEPISLMDSDRETIKGMISDLESGGGTGMADGMTNAYTVNRSALLSEGVNRVIVCSDGDANIGARGGDDLLALIEEYVDEGIMMSTLGFGLGNYKDNTMETLANKGNGNYYYIDGINEAQRIFGDKIAATIESIAIDTKIQVEFDSEKVRSYRLLGYENRDIADELFEVDSTDAGELGPGHTVTALYELVLTKGLPSNTTLGSVRLRFKDLQGTSFEESIEITTSNSMSFDDQDSDFRFATLVGEYADILRKTPHSTTTLTELQNIAQAWGLDDSDERIEFYEILKKASILE